MAQFALLMSLIGHRCPIAGGWRTDRLPTRFAPSMWPNRAGLDVLVSKSRNVTKVGPATLSPLTLPRGHERPVL
jgi:hypothetical protein